MRPGFLAAPLLLLALALAALADDDGATKLFRTKLARVGKTAASRYWEAADNARRASLYRFARELASRALEFDPDLRQARAFLGYVKRDAGWTVDTDVLSKLPTENALAAGVSGPLVRVEEAWRVTVAGRADADVAGMYAALGDECSNKSAPAGAQTAYAKALEFDPGNAVAHKGLGHVKFGDGLWLTSAENRAFETSKATRLLAEPNRWEEILGTPLTKVESGHFHLEGPYPSDVLGKYAEAGERVYAACLADLGLAPDTPVFRGRPVVCVLSDETQWNRWIDRMGLRNQGFSRQRAVHWNVESNAAALRNLERESDEARLDRLMHQIVHMMNFALWGMQPGQWLDEALAHRYTVILNGSTSHFCIAPRKEDYGNAGEERTWTDPSAWKEALKASVAKAEDKALRAVVLKSAFDLPVQSSIKAWSVAGWLIGRDRGAFLRLLQDLRGATDLGALVENRYGKSLENLDDEWRLWVLASY